MLTKGRNEGQAQALGTICHTPYAESTNSECSELEIATVVGDSFLAVVCDIGQQFFVEFFPARALQNLLEFLFTLDRAER